MTHDSKHRKRIEKYLKEIEGIYKNMIDAISYVAVKIHLEDELFKFKNYSNIEVLADAIFLKYAKDVYEIITKGTASEWKLANLKHDAIKQATIERISDRLNADVDLKNFAKTLHNETALEAFQRRKVGKFTISERVWDIGSKAKENIELAIDVALKEGMSAQELARQIKKELNNPDALYRKVRDKHGNLKLSKAAKAYKPGQGVYRSAHKNALRLAANEINIAYREAEQLRISQNNDVVGQRISLSPSHKIYDLCDELKGDYPKDFQWNQWHTNCKCFRTTILKKDEEIINELNSGQNLPPETSANYVKETPLQLHKWYAENEERMKNWKSKPSFVENNKAVFKKS